MPPTQKRNDHPKDDIDRRFATTAARNWATGGDNDHRPDPIDKLERCLLDSDGSRLGETTLPPIRKRNVHLKDDIDRRFATTAAKTWATGADNDHRTDTTDKLERPRRRPI